MQQRRAGGPIPSGALLFAYDLAATAASVVLALLLRFETLDVSEAVIPYLPVALLPLLVRPPVRLAFGLYRREWRFASVGELGDIVGSVTVGSILIVALYGLGASLGVVGANPFPRSFFIIEPLITASLVGGIRFLPRMRAENSVVRKPREDFQPTLIYGAGDAGAAIAASAARDAELGIRVVGFLDDDIRKVGSRLYGHRVHGGIDALRVAAERTGARQLLIAMPSRAGAPVRRALAAAHEIGLEVNTVPSIRDVITGSTRLARPREIRVEDLLRREPVALDTDAIAGYLNGASVVVTGGGGSIGGELVRQILRIGPRVLTVIDYHEGALWNVERDAASVLLAGNGPRLNPVLADVRSSAAMVSIIGRAKADVVFHAAALKHVPYVEMYPSEGVLTNVIGTRNVLAACERAEVPKFVLISTDKAVEPTSVMGGSKHLAEVLTIEAGHRSGFAYSAVRFGNVLGSSGSLVPLLERQLDDGMPLTITEPDATRYFMTLGEAVMLILQAGATASPGQIYVLDMGDPIRIGDLVRDLLRLHGVHDDHVEVKVTGLRPGEKLHEKLFGRDETPASTDHPGILRAAVDENPERIARSRDLVEAIVLAAEQNDDGTIRRLMTTTEGVAAPLRSSRFA